MHRFDGHGEGRTRDPNESSLWIPADLKLPVRPCSSARDGVTMTSMQRGRVVMVIALAGCVACTHKPARLPLAASAIPSPIPWIDATEPTPSPTPSPVAARACLGSEIAGVYAGANGASGHIGNGVVLANTGSSRCFLKGVPQISVFDSSGARIDAVDKAGGYMEITSSATVVMLPGKPLPTSGDAVPGEAYLGFEWEACRSTRQVSTIRITLPAGGGDVAIGVQDIGSSRGGAMATPLCEGNEPGVRVGSFLPVESTPPTSPIAALQAAIEPHGPADPGTRYHYLVQLSNPTSDPIALDPCPGYRELLNDTVPKAVTLETHELNCGVADAVPAHGSLTFAMEIAVPANAAAAPGILSWDLDVAGAESNMPARITIT